MRYVQGNRLFGEDKEFYLFKKLKIIGWNRILYQIYLPVGFSAEMYKYFEDIGVVGETDSNITGR